MAQLRQRLRPFTRNIDVSNALLSSASQFPSPNEDAPVFIPPPFSIKDLLGAIPAHCYERSTLRSSAYLALDVAMISSLAVAACYIDSPRLGLPSAARFALWTVYALLQGMIGTGLWVLAHECGHLAFSPHKSVNHAVGWVLHSCLLVPYHSWRISHGRHHSGAGHMSRDQVFIPRTEAFAAEHRNNVKRTHRLLQALGWSTTKFDAGVARADEILEDAPLYVLANLIVQQLVGWPLYIVSNASGQDYGRRANHFEPSSPIFEPRHRSQILWSDFGIGLVCATLYYLSLTFGFSTMVKFYFIPYICVNNYLLLITYLQHTDPEVPHYRQGEWNFQRGALCTIDRNFLGPIGSFFWHGITETHIAHHLSSKIPHYHAWEATEALKTVLGDYYRSSDENMFVSLYKTYRDCVYVDSVGDVVFYRDTNGKARRRPVVSGESFSDSGVEVQ